MKKSEFKINKSSFELNKLITTSRMFSKINLMMSSRLVLRCIVDFWNPNLGYAYPTQKTIADCTGLSEVSVFQAVKELETKNVLKKEKINKRIHYKFTLTCLGYLNLVPKVTYGSSQTCLGNIPEVSYDNNILINKENTSSSNSSEPELTEDEWKRITIKNLGNNPLFQRMLENLKSDTINKNGP